ncbi:MAG: zf-HC2 domain-containing protein [Elusimicrobia bacterium]|nr:zf-HC2 domain-containing protein [Elusimicrobiota bacterium]
MKKCDDMKDLLEAYADRQASLAEQKAVLSHLESCGGCRGVLRWIAASKAAVKGVPLPALPADLKRALLAEAARVRAARAPNPLARVREFWALRPWQVGLAFAGAAAAVVLFARLSAGRPEVLPLDAMLAAHSEYERTMPLSSQEQLLAELPERMSAGGTDHEM